MADVVITIPVSSVQYTTWLRTSYVGLSKVSSSGTPMIEQIEFGVDQEDALVDFLSEATREVLKIFISRQGDVTGIPFEYDGVNVIYRFLEGEPVLPQAFAIKSLLDEDVKNCLFTYVTYLWFKFKSEVEQANYFLGRYHKLTSDIDRHLYKLHD